MKSVLHRICDSCGKDGANVLVKRDARWGDVYICVECTPDEVIQGKCSAREAYYNEITMTVRECVASV